MWESVEGECCREEGAMAAYSGLTHKHTAPLVHILGIVGIVLVVIWTSYYRGGYGLTGSAVFNVSGPSLFPFLGFLSSATKPSGVPFCFHFSFSKYRFSH